MVDRTQFPAGGLADGHPGAAGKFEKNGTPAATKTILWLEPDDQVRLQLPGGGGYGRPASRDPQRVLHDVVNGYVTAESARDIYGVEVSYQGADDDLVRRPEDYVVTERPQPPRTEKA